MSINNLLKPNNYDVQVGSISMNGGNELTDYKIGSFNWNYTITNNTATGSIPVRYVKIGQLVTLFLREVEIIVTNPGIIILSGLPTILNPEASFGAGGDFAEFSLLYINGSLLYKSDIIISVSGPGVSLSYSGRIVSNNDASNDLAADAYTIQQTTFSYISAN